MEANDVEPYTNDVEPYTPTRKSGRVHFWDGPDCDMSYGKERLPADVWALVGGGLDDTETRDFSSRDDAVCALEVALRKLGKISE
jgi:hypothetical protein